MINKRFLKILSLALILIFITAFVWATFTVFPAISGYGAKNLCSAVFIQKRNSQEVIKEDLSAFPQSLGNFKVDEKDSSVSGTVFGMGKRKAIYLNGCGCVLVNDYSEEEVRKLKFSLPTKPAVNTDTIAWPYGDKVTDTVPQTIDKKKLKTLINTVLNETLADGSPAYTRAVLVVYDGKLIAEQYAPGFNNKTVMLGWSMSKSLIGAMIGILVKEGKITVNNPAPLSEWKNSEKNIITIKNLLQQTSGIDFKENYSNPSNVTKMLFSTGDMAAYTASLPLKNKPGSQFNYSSGNTNILSGIIRKLVGEKDYHGFPYKQLFHKINAYSFMLETDASGTYVGSSYSYATARDFARFGLLYYNNGLWNGQQILPEQWVKESIQPSSADKRKHYGYQIWLNGSDANDSTKRWYPDVPADMFFADGFGGQDIYVIPTKKLVVVRLGVFPIDENKFLKELIATIHY